MTFQTAFADIMTERDHDAHRVVPEALWAGRPRRGYKFDVQVDGYGMRDGGFAIFMQVHEYATDRRTLHFIRRVPTFKGLERVIKRFGHKVDAETVTWRCDETAPKCYMALVPDYKAD